MALKDWRKDGANDWFHKVKDIHISIEKAFKSDPLIDYLVAIMYDGRLSHDSRYFKTKQQALKYAKSYMRNN